MRLEISRDQLRGIENGLKRATEAFAARAHALVSGEAPLAPSAFAISHEAYVKRRDARVGVPLRLLLVAGDRRDDCQGLSECLADVVRVAPTAEHASCPSPCSSFQPLDRHLERHMAMAGRGDGGGAFTSVVRGG